MRPTPRATERDHASFCSTPGDPDCNCLDVERAAFAHGLAHAATYPNCCSDACACDRDTFTVCPAHTGYTD